MSAILFPEFVNRAISKGIYYHNNVISSIIATSSTVDTLDYRTVLSNMETSTFSGNEVPESGYLPEIRIETNPNLISLEPV